jgi:hypothetical protein
MAFVVPTFQSRSARYIIGVELAGEKFRLRFYWNTREEFWYMDILDQDDNNLITGIKMVINYSLLDQYVAVIGIPKGNFILWDLEKDVSGEVTFDNFGRRYQLIFLSDSEIAAGSFSLGL